MSTADAAAALGVGVSTIKRWVDEGILPAQRTGGGHRKLLRAEVLALARQKSLPLGDSAGLLIPSRKATAIESFEPALLDALLAGDAGRVRSLLGRVYRSGFAFETIGDRLIAPVMRQVGHQWETNHIDIWQEHRATQVCTTALSELLAEIAPRAERNRPLALGAGPEGDPYQLALLLGQLALTDNGWDVVNLGPNTPFGSLTAALQELRPRLVWISTSYVDDAKKFVREYRLFQQEASRQNVPIAIGGSAFTESLRSQLTYTAFGDGLSQLIEFARVLHPRRAPPRRGRPPGRHGA